jgi:N-acetylglutamate synthase-like GNAT family acetyltransferase
MAEGEDVMNVRPASAADIPVIAAIIQSHAQRGEMLPRSADDIRQNLSDFVV